MYSYQCEYCSGKFSKSEIDDYRGCPGCGSRAFKFDGLQPVYHDGTFTTVGDFSPSYLSGSSSSAVLIGAERRYPVGTPMVTHYLDTGAIVNWRA